MANSAIQSAQFGVATESQRGVVNGTDARNLVFGGSALSFRNKIINGACLVAQRGNIAAVNNGATYGGADRFFVAPLSFTTAAGTIAKSALSGTAAGFGQWLSSTTTTGSGTIVFGQRIESQNTLDLNSKSVTFSGYLYQDTGSTVSVTVSVNRANGVDNFAAVTSLSTKSISVPTATLTSFTLTVALGATDGNNGISCEASFPVGAVTNKNFAISSWQLEAGSVATPFENRPISQVLQDCMRYYERWQASDPYSFFMIGAGASTTSLSFSYPFKVSKRTSNYTFTYGGSFANFVGAGTISGFFIQGDGKTADTGAFSAGGTGFTTGGVYFLRANNNSSTFAAFDAEL